MSIDDRLTYMGLRAFNFLYDTAVFLKTATKQGLSDFSAYMGGRYAIWHFLDNAIGPLPDSIVKNRNHIVWSYNSDRNILHHHQSVENTYRGVSWLAATISCNGDEYDISNFARSFFYSAPEEFMPNRSLFLTCWSLNSGIWFTPNDNPQLQIVDDNGDEHTIYLFDRSSASIDHWCSLLGFNDETDSDRNEVIDGDDVSDDLPASEGVPDENEVLEDGVVSDTDQNEAADQAHEQTSEQAQEQTSEQAQEQSQPVIVEHRELTSEDMEMVD